jgi:hypothetical protein
VRLLEVVPNPVCSVDTAEVFVDILESAEVILFVKDCIFPSAVPSLDKILVICVPIEDTDVCSDDTAEAFVDILDSAEVSLLVKEVILDSAEVILLVKEVILEE